MSATSCSAWVIHGWPRRILHLSSGLATSQAGLPSWKAEGWVSIDCFECPA